MNSPLLLSNLPSKHQIIFCALTCEKMLYSVEFFDKYERNKASIAYKEAITFLYEFALENTPSLVEFVPIKAGIEYFCPDIDESENEYAPYALHSFIAMLEALDFILEQDSIHVVNCATAATDTVDMYVQMASESEPPAMPELDRFIQSNPFMIREVKRQKILLEDLMKLPSINIGSIDYLRKLNNYEAIIDLNFI